MAVLTDEQAAQVLVVRSLTADLDPVKPLLTDPQLWGFLTLYTGNPKRAAARALRTVAASEVLVGKKITTQDLTTDAPAVSAELRALAAELWAEAEADAAAEAESDESFMFVPNHGHLGVEGEEARYW